MEEDPMKPHRLPDGTIIGLGDLTPAEGDFLKTLR
jgi:hypothetical protein